MRRIPYGRQSLDAKEFKAVLEVLKSDFITQGSRVEDFEAALAKKTAARYAVAVSSGTGALHLACLAADMGRGDRGITSPITFVSTANSLVYCGATPVFADVDGRTVNIDPMEIEKRITKKTKVILPVHFAGLPADMPAIFALAKKHGLTVIEDACHALGARYRHRGKWIPVGSCAHSHMAVFSFHPVKHITTGEGGAITTNSKPLYNRLRALRSHGIYKDAMIQKQGGWRYEMRELGANYRMTEIQAVMGISQLEKLDGFLKKRRSLVKRYNRAFQSIASLQLPPNDSERAEHAWHLYVVRTENSKVRKRLFNYLHQNGVMAQVHYIPVYQQPYYEQRGFTKVRCVNAEQYYEQCLSIPLFPGLSREDQERVVRLLHRFFGIG